MTTFSVLVHDLTTKQQKFVKNILTAVSEGKEDYTQTQAAIDVGGMTDGSAAVQASRWMQKEKVLNSIYKGLIKGATAEIEEAKWPGVKKVTEDWIIACLGQLAVHPKTAANNKIACHKLIGSWRKLNMWREVQIVEDIDKAKADQELLRDVDELEREINRPAEGSDPKGEKAPGKDTGSQGEKSAGLRGADGDSGSVPERPSASQDSLDGERGREDG